MPNLDDIARKFQSALRELAGDTPAFTAPPLAPVQRDAELAAAPVDALAVELPQSAQFLRDDFDKTVHVDVEFSRGTLRITPVYDDSGLMVAADFAQIDGNAP